MAKFTQINKKNTKNNNNNNYHSFQASVSFIVQPIGNLLSTFLVDAIGRKWSIFAVNFVPAIAWILLPFAKSQAVILIGFSLLGIGVGLTGSITYISEIW